MDKIRRMGVIMKLLLCILLFVSVKTFGAGSFTDLFHIGVIGTSSDTVLEIGDTGEYRYNFSTSKMQFSHNGTNFYDVVGRTDTITIQNKTLDSTNLLNSPKHGRIIELADDSIESGSRTPIIDFHATDSVDFSLRLSRNSGVNGDMHLQNTGTGTMFFDFAAGQSLYLPNTRGSARIARENDVALGEGGQLVLDAAASGGTAVYLDNVSTGAFRVHNGTNVWLDVNASSISAVNKKIINVTNPTAAQDAATKSYVDTAVVGANDHTLTSSNTLQNKTIDNSNIIGANRHGNIEVNDDTVGGGGNRLAFIDFHSSPGIDGNYRISQAAGPTGWVTHEMFNAGRMRFRIGGSYKFDITTDFLDLYNIKVRNMGDPTNAQDAVTLNYLNNYENNHARITMERIAPAGTVSVRRGEQVFTSCTNAHPMVCTLAAAVAFNGAYCTVTASDNVSDFCWVYGLTGTTVTVGCQNHNGSVTTQVAYKNFLCAHY